MFDILNIILTAALVNNIVLAQSLGVSSLFAYSQRLDQAVELALFTLPVLFATAGISLALDRLLLVPLQLGFLRLLVAVAIGAILSTLLAQIVHRHFPLSYRRNRLAFCLAGANSAVIGLVLLPNLRDMPSLQTLAVVLGTGLGFALLVISFAALRRRLDSADVPAVFRGAPVYLISAGILSLSLLGLRGVG